MQYIEYKTNDHIAIITIAKEKSLNALNTKVLTELDGVLDQVKADKDIYCLIITGAGEKSFVAGADVYEMKDFGVEQAVELGAFGNKVFRKIETLEMPVVAAVNGYALGGGLELALSCDIRIASDNALFGFPETGLGIIPGYGGTQRLPRTIGTSAAKKLIFTGMKIGADEAYRLGIVDEVAKQSELMDVVGKLAGKIVRQAPIAVANAKKAVNEGMDLDIDTALGVETEMFSKCFATSDQKKGMDAFIKKERIDRFENK